MPLFHRTGRAFLALNDELLALQPGSGGLLVDGIHPAGEAGYGMFLMPAITVFTERPRAGRQWETGSGGKNPGSRKLAAETTDYRREWFQL